LTTPFSEWKRKSPFVRSRAHKFGDRTENRKGGEHDERRHLKRQKGKRTVCRRGKEKRKAEGTVPDPSRREGRERTCLRLIDKKGVGGTFR